MTKFNKLANRILNEDKISDEVYTLKEILSGRLGGLDSDAPMKDYYKVIRKKIKKFKKLSDEELGDLIDTLESQFPNEMGVNDWDD